jgi:hypothetical protein
MKPSTIPARVAPLAVLAVLTGCAIIVTGEPAPAFVVLGEGGAAVARVVTTGAACPAITLDQRSVPMAVRAPHGAIPARGPGPDSPAVLTCEAVIPPGTAQASVAGQALPLPRARAQRIVVIGDTGCRLVKGAYQDCMDPEGFPFRRVAAAAAAWKPDLVIHVGDYHYREAACPAGHRGCARSPWGYGWDAWNADLFDPGRTLLQAAPWVVVRGNHESCARAGQGYWRFLDPRALQAGRDCNVPADDGIGDYSDPYTVPLGDGAQLIVFDSSNTSHNGLAAGDVRREKYADAWRKMDAMTGKASYNIAVAHHPVFGFGAYTSAKTGAVIPFGGDAGLHDAFGALDPGFLPQRVSMLLSGHVHLWQQVSFSSGHPTQFISGFSGTAEDTTPLPAVMPANVVAAPGAVVDNMSTWIGGFGFMTMERAGADAWEVKVWDRYGAHRNACSVRGRKSVCRLAQVAPEPLPQGWAADR